jgi:ribonucleoside-diphosphate reductase beta chain
MKWSVRDEALHSKMGCLLFNELCNEYPNLRNEVAEEVIESSYIMKEMEHRFIDKIFEQGDLENLKSEDLKNFISLRINDKLKEIGLSNYKNAKHEYNEESANKLKWFYVLTSGTEHSDFFAIRPTDYSKPSEDEDWDI